METEYRAKFKVGEEISGLLTYPRSCGSDVLRSRHEGSSGHSCSGAPGGPRAGKRR